MLSKAMQDAINEQIKNELYSAYLYPSMSAYCESINLPGFAHWMRVQHGEETGHAMKFYDYVFDRGGRVVLQAIEKPPVEYKSVQDVFKETLEHERKVTAMIYNLCSLAAKENDYATTEMLQWFVKEQVEEEKSAAQIIEQLKLTDDQKPKVKAMLEERQKKRQEMFGENSSVPQDQRREKMQTLMQEQDKKLKAILTPEQYEKWEKALQALAADPATGFGANGRTPILDLLVWKGVSSNVDLWRDA